jgi:threonine dehydrogenase-like Zn-dependent dehydrogenase
MERQPTTSERLAPQTGQRKTMRAAVIIAPKKIQIREVTLPEPSADEVRIRMQGCGLCGSDLPVWEGRDWFDYPRMPGAPGHEGYGIIDSVGKNVKNLKPGIRVAALTYNAYAEYDVAKADHVVVLPPSVAEIPFIGEPLGCAMNIFKRSGITKQDIVAVIGGGFIGNLLIQLAKSTGAQVIAISKRETSLQKAFESGADHIIHMDDHYKILNKIKDLTEFKGCSRVIEATGKQWPLDIAGDIIGERGRMIIAGFHQDGLRQINLQNWNWKGIDVINAHERNPLEYCNGMLNAIDAVERKILNPGILYSHFFHFEDLEKAFQVLSTREEGFMKAVIQF